MRIVRVTTTDFELEDGRTYQHPVALEKAPSLKQFQAIYEAELVEDMISLMSSFSARIYGRRSAENQRKKKEAKGAN